MTAQIMNYNKCRILD